MAQELGRIKLQNTRSRPKGVGEGPAEKRKLFNLTKLKGLRGTKRTGLPAKATSPALRAPKMDLTVQTPSQGREKQGGEGGGERRI